MSIVYLGRSLSTVVDFIQRQHEKQLAQLQEEKRQQEERALAGTETVARRKRTASEGQ
jgi:hypothetical protein